MSSSSSSTTSSKSCSKSRLFGLVSVAIIIILVLLNVLSFPLPSTYSSYSYTTTVKGEKSPILPTTLLASTSPSTDETKMGVVSSKSPTAAMSSMSSISSSSSSSSTSIISNGHIIHPPAPPCNLSGTHYLFDNRYHYHANSSDFIRALKEGVYSYSSESSTDENDDENENVNNGPKDDDDDDDDDGESNNMMGVLYSVSGTETFVTLAFLPVVEYLKKGLGIPDALERQRQRQRQKKQQQQQQQSSDDNTNTKWALATEPHLCNSDLLQKSVLPFFDVLIIITPDDLRNEDNKATEILLDNPTMNSSSINNNNSSSSGSSSTSSSQTMNE